MYRYVVVALLPPSERKAIVGQLCLGHFLIWPFFQMYLFINV